MLYPPAAPESGFVGVTPGWVLSRSRVLRPFSGNSMMAMPVTVPPTVAFSVSTWLPVLSTTTVSVNLPTGSWISTRMVWLISRAFWGTIVTFSNPAALAVILYLPIGSRRAWYTPEESVLAALLKLVSRLVTVTLALVTTAPEGSVTTPVI